MRYASSLSGSLKAANTESFGPSSRFLLFRFRFDSWDGGSYWNHVGYPDDIGGGTVPAWELWFSIANSWSPGYFETGSGLDIETFASLNHGDSGGPIFGWWTDGPYGSSPSGPYIVAVVSSQGTLSPVVTNWSTRTGNWLAGGSELTGLVEQAVSDYP